MEKYEIVKYKTDTVELDIRVSIDENTVWLTKEQIAVLFDRDRTAVSKHINNIYNESELDKNSTCAKNARVQIEGTRSITRTIEFYNLDVVLAVGYRVKSKNGLLLKEWFDSYIFSKNKEIIVCNNGDIKLDVRIEPTRDTVWLNANQISMLFDTSTNNIYMHIQNIYNEQEIDDSVSKESLVTRKEMVQISSDGKAYSVTFYNLDVILAVGYRVKSKRAIEFRKWATNVLKQYLIKGYAISPERALVTNENYLNLIYDVNNLKKDVSEIKDWLNKKAVNPFVCYEGQYFDGFVFINDLIKSANKEVVVVDGYADDNLFKFFKGIDKEIKKTIICHRAKRISDETLETFIKQYGEISILENKTFHDRFLIVDEDVYMIGSSLNSIGNKTTVVIKTQDLNIKDIIGTKLI